MQQNEKPKRGRPRGRKADTDTTPIQALERGIRILQALSDQQQGVSLSDLARKVEMPPSTTHRFLATLQSHGFVVSAEQNQLWSIGIGAFRVGNSYLNRTNLVEAAQAPLRQLMEQTGETANLGIADQGFIVFISQIETQNPIRAMFRAGARSQMHASGIGKAMLAHMPRAEVEKLVETNGLPKFTAQTLTTNQALFCDLEVSAARGWAFDNEERYKGMRCVASAVFDRLGAPVAGISVSGPAARFTDEKIAHFGGIISQAARNLTEITTGQNPVSGVGAFYDSSKG